ncbi:SsrA-binding protein SmpB [Phaeobacter italicus]|uniref:SsrA-binding protein SmpB n=1 Tax=Phaeobacter italicus TaxID=481446 RepID=UPI00248EEE39|nr:SsrA-binding protein SmpB [Phaeobacter italicus]
MSNIESVCQNRKARFEYSIEDTLEAGIVLTGTEIKSVRNHGVSLDGSYARVDDGEVWLIDSNIAEYTEGNSFNHDPKRKRKLLLHRKEISKFADTAAQQGFALIPLSMYLKDGIAKIELAIAKGKKQHDKRQALKEKDAKREIREAGG